MPQGLPVCPARRALARASLNSADCQGGSPGDKLNQPVLPSLRSTGFVCLAGRSRKACSVPVLSVQRTVANGFGDVLLGYIGAAVQIGYCARDLYEPREATR